MKGGVIGVYGTALNAVQMLEVSTLEKFWILPFHHYCCAAPIFIAVAA